MPRDDQTPTVLILDLSVSSNQFISDHRTQSLASRLEQSGVSVVIAHGVVNGADDTRRLAEIVSKQPFEPVVMVHAWDTELIQTVRTSMDPSSRLVRLTDGVRAALDAEFDYVVNDDELDELLRGGTPTEGGAWKPTTASELRRHGPDPRTANPGNVVQWIALHDDDDDSGRPTISGPSPGCPFLLDTRANPIYKDVELDPDQIQTRGCSFCLDNFGAYTVSSEADTVASWMEQIRRVRSERPQTREFLLTDERPHPYLPALFRALSADDTIAPVELLIKSRIDWLLEYADGALSEASTAAAERGHVLHVYLIGFESFEQFHLDLFNKGVSVADNLEAIDKVRELDARFPESFEYRRLRAHGIVLFTPWTEPEHLLVNARVMRDVRFEEFRADALDTRLRLYPRVPLHSKAEQEGLLLESFPSGRPDRAGEQGYDASVPWKFADKRTEAIFQLGRALSTHSRSASIRDADLLELATHFIVRWPGLSDTPESAHLAFLAVVGNLAHEDVARHAREMIDLDATAALVFDDELEGVEAGLKQVALKEGVPLDRAESLVAAYGAMGFAAGIASRQGAGLDSGSGAVGGEQSRAIVAVAADEKTLAEAIQLDATIHARGAGRSDAVRRMGELLGYPACCVTAFADLDDHSDNLQLERQPFLRAPEARLEPLNNRLAMGAALVSHHLCRPDCQESAKRAAVLLTRLENVSPQGAAWRTDRLSRDRLVLGYDAQVELDGDWQDTQYIVRNAGALGGAVRAELWAKARSFSMDADGVAIGLEGGSRTRVATANPLLIQPGRPMAASALQALTATSKIAARSSPSKTKDTFDTAAEAGGGARPSVLSPEQTTAFLSTCFGAESTPIEIGQQVLIVDCAPARSKCGFDLEMTDPWGSRLRAYVVRSKAGEPAYAQSAWMSLAYYGGNDEAGAPGPAEVETMMNALRDALVAADGGLDEESASALFAPAGD